MQVIECDLPPGSALSRELIGNAYFHDPYRAPLTRPELRIVEVFFALFGHTPIWMKLIADRPQRHARVFGLEAPTVNEITEAHRAERAICGRQDRTLADLLHRRQ